MPPWSGPPERETVKLTGGQTLTNVHPRGTCKGAHCAIHRPSDHHMLEWPQWFREDRGMMERLCSHSIGHPDPDDPAVERRHGCDGCCAKPHLGGIDADSPWDGSLDAANASDAMPSRTAAQVRAELTAKAREAHRLPRCTARGECPCRWHALHHEIGSLQDELAGLTGA